MCSSSNRTSLEVAHPFAAAAAAGPFAAPSARSSLDSMPLACLQAQQQQRASMDVSSRRYSMTLIVPNWECSTAAYDAAPYDAAANGLISPAAGGAWCRDQSYTPAALAAQQQHLLLSGPLQTPTGCHMYQQQQQQQVTAQRAATSPMPLLVPVCTAAAGNQPLQMQQQLMQQQQQQVVLMSSPMPSAEYIFFDDCAPSYGGHHMNAISAGTGCNASAIPSARRSSFCSDYHTLPLLPAPRQRPASFSADTRYNQQQQQQQLMMLADGQQLSAAAAAACSSSLSCPLPMLLPPQQQQQQQQQQMLLCQEMGFGGQQPAAVCRPSLDAASFQGGLMHEVPAMPVPTTLQQQQQRQQQQLVMFGLDAARVPGSPLPGLMLPDMQGSNQQLQQQQQMCMPLGAAMVGCDAQLPGNASPLAQAPADLGVAAAQSKLQQLLLDSKLVSQWQQNIQQELLQLLPMP
uniref:Uncharacterized protein n=1 Tax=Tetradesmus obliquus TaxID=3088 RepID=A0A383V793_TETOB